jgi:hypothetical protein
MLLRLIDNVIHSWTQTLTISSISKTNGIERANDLNEREREQGERKWHLTPRSRDEQLVLLCHPGAVGVPLS